MQSIQSPLPPLQQDSLRSWLTRDEFAILSEVIVSLAFEMEIEAANALIESRGGSFPSYADKANACANRAQEYLRTLELLTSLRTQKEPFHITTAKPS